MHRAQPAEVQVALRPCKVQLRKGKLQRDEHADQKPDRAPEGRGNRARPDHAVEILVLEVRFRIACGPQDPEKSDGSRKHHRDRVDLIGKVPGIIGRDRGADRNHAQRDQFKVIPHRFRVPSSCLAGFARSDSGQRRALGRFALCRAGAGNALIWVNLPGAGA